MHLEECEIIKIDGVEALVIEAQRTATSILVIVTTNPASPTQPSPSPIYRVFEAVTQNYYLCDGVKYKLVIDDEPSDDSSVGVDAFLVTVSDD